MNCKIKILILQCLALLHGVIAVDYFSEVTIGDQEGTIYTPGYPNSYGENDNCTWILTAPEHHRIELTFLPPFSTEKECDWVRVYEGNSIFGTRSIGNFSGSTLPPKLYSAGNNMTVNFCSDSFSDPWNVAVGFLANYKKIYDGVVVQRKFDFVSRPSNVEIAGGSVETVTMTCRVEDYLAVQINWIHDGVPVVTGDRLTIQPSGDLEIIDVEHNDRGTYVCIVTNGVEVIKAAATLTVRNRTIIKTDYPLGSGHNVVTADGDPVHISCNVSEYDKMINVSVEWQRNDKRINSSSDDRITIIDTKRGHQIISSKLTIENVTVADTGRYVCVAKTRIDEHSDYVQLDVRTNPPSPPHVMRIQCYAKEASIGWESAPDALSFSVQYNTSFAPDIWKTVLDSIPASEGDYTLRVPLSPGQNYSFRVLARNEAGFSDPSKYFPLVCSSDEEVPKKNPENVVAQRKEPTSLVISWTPLSPSDHGGSQLYYEVWWKPNIENALWQSVKLIDWNESEYMVNVESTPQEYVIFVLAGNVKGVAVQPVQKVYAYAGQAKLVSRNDYKMERELQEMDSDPLDSDPNL